MERLPCPEAPAAGASAFPPGAPVSWGAPWPGAARMAADEAAFADADAGPGPAEARLAFWRWDRPTISLGRLQDPATALDPGALAALGCPVVRRPTGGRAILHADEWTYSALVPFDHPVLGGSLAASTRAVVGVLAAALGEAYGIPFDPPADGPGERADGSPEACFARTFGYELAWRGRKVMGSAQRRGRRVLLQQGSLLVGGGHERLARVLPGTEAERAGVEASLAAGATGLAAILSRRPDPAPFVAALERRWPAGGAARGKVGVKPHREP